jgi:hypothetical protein
LPLLLIATEKSERLVFAYMPPSIGQTVTGRECTDRSRVLPRVIGSIGSLERERIMRLYRHHSPANGSETQHAVASSRHFACKEMPHTIAARPTAISDAPSNFMASVAAVGVGKGTPADFCWRPRGSDR